MADDDLIPVEIKKIAISSIACAIAVGNDEKEFPIYIEPAIGAAIRMFIEDVEKPRPLTHDLIGSLLDGFGASVERIIINDLRDNTYFARMILRAENELGTKLVEIDCRPSDAMAVAKMKGAPLFVTRKVLDAVGKAQNEADDESEDE
jgi:bifunctional DNase/RNase